MKIEKPKAAGLKEPAVLFQKKLSSAKIQIKIFIGKFFTEKNLWIFYFSESCLALHSSISSFVTDNIETKERIRIVSPIPITLTNQRKDKRLFHPMVILSFILTFMNNSNEIHKLIFETSG